MAHFILVVEDSTGDAARIAGLVESLIDSRIEYASNRHEAWARITEGKFDVVVLDLDLGGVSEGELLLEKMQTYLRSPPGTLVVSITGNMPQAQRLKAKFDFVVETTQKWQVLELKKLMRASLKEAIRKTQSGASASREGARPVVGRRGLSGGRIGIIAATIGALATILAALITTCGNATF